VYLGYHWITDVVGSWILAATVTSIAMAFITANQRPDWGTMLRDAVAPRDAFSRITSLVVGYDQPGPLVRR
jgi:membrane-associated phospholipid phosphatase